MLISSMIQRVKISATEVRNAYNEEDLVNLDANLLPHSCRRSALP